MDAALRQFVEEHKNLFWYTPKDKLFEISDELLVETILNYGTLNDVKELFRLLGIKKAAEIFFHSINLSERRKNNYYPEVCNFFTLLFKRYA